MVQSVPVVHTPVRLSALGASEIVRLLHKHNVSEHVLPAPQSVLVSRRAGHVRTIVFEWPEPGLPAIPALPISIGPDKLTEADLINLLQALLRRYTITVHLPDTEELVNTQIVGLNFARATLRLRMRDDGDGSLGDELMMMGSDDRHSGGRGGGGVGGEDGVVSRGVSSAQHNASSRGLGSWEPTVGGSGTGYGAEGQTGARRAVARNGQRLIIEGLTCTVGTDVHSARHGISARLRLTLTNLTLAFDLMSTDMLLFESPADAATPAAPPAPAAAAAAAVSAAGEAQQEPAGAGSAEAPPRLLPGMRVTGMRVDTVWLGGSALRPPRAAPPAAAADAARRAAAAAAGAAGYTPPSERAELVEAPDIEGPLRYLRRHATVHVRALDVPLALARPQPTAAAGAGAQETARRRGAPNAGPAGARGREEEEEEEEEERRRQSGAPALRHDPQSGLAKLVTLCRSHAAASRMFRGMFTDMALAAILNLLLPQTDATVAAIAAREAAEAAAEAAAAAGEPSPPPPVHAAKARRPPAPQPTLPTLLARSMEDALSPAAARTSMPAHLLRELVVERRAFVLPLDADARDELARQHGLHNPTLAVVRWGAVDVSLGTPAHALILSDVLVRFDCELKRSVVGELTFDGAIHLVLRIARLPVLFEPRNGTVLDWQSVDCTVVHSEVTANPPGASRAMLSASRVLFNPEAEVAAHVDRFIQEELRKVFQNLARDLWALKPPRAASGSESALVVAAQAESPAGGGANSGGGERQLRLDSERAAAHAADWMGATGEQASEWRRWAEERTVPAPRGGG